MRPQRHDLGDPVRMLRINEAPDAIASHFEGRRAGWDHSGPVGHLRDIWRSGMTAPISQWENGVPGMA